MSTKLKKSHGEAIKASKGQPVPVIVLAYQDVYCAFPHGWPPWKFDWDGD